MPAGNQNSLIKKASAQNRAKALKIMRFLGLVANQGGLFHLPENTFLKKSVAKVLQKRLLKKMPSPETRINIGLFGTSKPKGTTPIAPCKAILNAFVYEIYQRVFILLELSVKHTLSDFLLPYRCHKII